jgi:hypothetical protein
MGHNDNHFGKKLLIICLTSFISYTSMGQVNITGQYKLSAHGDPQGGGAMFVFENHQFIVAYFGGAMVGTWQISKNNLVAFSPTVPKAGFRLYARHNKALGNASRIFFGGFENGETTVGFEPATTASPLLKKVFNDDPNCFSFPYVHKLNTIPQALTFSAKGIDADGNLNKAAADSVFVFNNAGGCNDFVAHYIKPDLNARPFTAVFKNNSLHFDNDVSVRRPLEQSEEAEQFRAYVNQPLSSDALYFNPLYKQVDSAVEKDVHNYKFDEKKNAYINFLNYKEGEELKTDYDYNNPNVVYKFVAVPLANTVLTKIRVDPKPLFTATCK